MVSNSKKRGQVTIFIILAILLVAVALSIFYFIPKIKTTTGFDEKNPNLFLQSCLEDTLTEVVEIISLQGGSYELDFSYNYVDQDESDQTTNYLCYEQESFEASCTVLQPMLRTHIEKEITRELTPEFNNCFNELMSKYRAKGYDVDSTQGELETLLLPNKVTLSSTAELRLTKKENLKQTDFKVSVESNIYDFVRIANEILLWETAFGDAPIMNVMYNHQEYDVQKRDLEGDDTKVYLLQHLETLEKFNFASRALNYQGERSINV